MSSKKIDHFRGIYAFLSNFYPCTVEYDTNKYPSVEHAFQAAKTLNRQEQYKIWLAKTPNEAKKLGRQVTLRPDWEEVKIDVMRQLIHQKFQNRIFRLKLLATRNAELIEGNHWHDYFWGVCNGQGQNWLGKILMEEREKIKDGDKQIIQSRLYGVYENTPK